MSHLPCDVGGVWGPGEGDGGGCSAGGGQAIDWRAGRLTAGVAVGQVVTGEDWGIRVQVEIGEYEFRLRLPDRLSMTGLWGV